MMSTIRDYAKLSADLVDAPHLEQPPVAIRFSDSAPDGLDTPAKHIAAGCRFWEDATFAMSAKDHEMCAIDMGYVAVSKTYLPAETPAE